MKANKAQTFPVCRVLLNLSDKAERVTVTFDIEAEAREAFNATWLHNFARQIAPKLSGVVSKRCV